MLTLTVEHNYICFKNIQEFTTTCFGPICGPSLGSKHGVVVNSCIFLKQIYLCSTVSVSIPNSYYCTNHNRDDAHWNTVRLVC